MPVNFAPAISRDTMTFTGGLRLIGLGVALPRRMPPIKQGTTGLRATCGPTCLEAVLRYWNPGRSFVVTGEDLTAATAAVNSFMLQPRLAAGGTLWNDPIGLAAVAIQNGLKAKVEYGGGLFLNPAATLAGWVANGETVIVHRVLDGRSPAEGHYCVIEGVDSYGVHLMDPGAHASQYHCVPWAQFLPQFNNALFPLGTAIRVSNQLVV